MDVGSYSALGGKTATECARGATPVDRVQDALTDASLLAERVRALADALVGPVPEACAKEGQAPAPMGLFNLMEERARVVSRQIGDAQAALNRIDEAFA